MKTNGLKILALLFIIPMLVSCATSAGGHKASEMVSAQLTLVAEEGKRFAQQRDSLAKSRLLVMQDLENSASVVELENDMDRMAWEIIGASFRTNLYEGTLKATQKEEKRLAQQRQRRTEQEKALADIRSAIRFKHDELVAAAKKLSLLSKAPSADERRKQLQKFAEEVVSNIQKETVEASKKVEDGKKLVQNAEKKINGKKIEDTRLQNPKKDTEPKQ